MSFCRIAKAAPHELGVFTFRYCRQRGLALSTFQYWKRQLRDGAVGGAARSAARASVGDTPAFTEIALPSSGEDPGGEAAPTEVELALGAGVRVTIRWSRSC